METQTNEFGNICSDTEIQTENITPYVNNHIKSIQMKSKSLNNLKLNKYYDPEAHVFIDDNIKNTSQSNKINNNNYESIISITKSDKSNSHY